MKIRCVVERITYQNPDNRYSVLKVRMKGYSELVAVVGNLFDVNVGSEYPIVVMPFLMNHFVMLQHNLLYTDITRAKKILVIVFLVA